MRLNLSIGTIRAGYIIGFVAGIICIGLAIFLVVYCFTVTQFIGGYNSYYTSIDLSNFPVSYAGLACIPLLLGAVLIYNTYQFFIPEKKAPAMSASKPCIYCGALLEEDAVACKKCNRPLEWRQL